MTKAPWAAWPRGRLGSSPSSFPTQGTLSLSPILCSDLVPSSPAPPLGACSPTQLSALLSSEGLKSQASALGQGWGGPKVTNSPFMSPVGGGGHHYLHRRKAGCRGGLPRVTQKVSRWLGLESKLQRPPVTTFLESPDWLTPAVPLPLLKPAPSCEQLCLVVSPGHPSTGLSQGESGKAQPLHPWLGRLFSHISFQCSEAWLRSRDKGAPVHTRCHPWQGANNHSNRASSFQRAVPHSRRPRPPAPPGIMKGTGFPTTVIDKFIEVWEGTDGQRINKRRDGHKTNR